MNIPSNLDFITAQPDDLIGPLNEIEKKYAPPKLFLKGNRHLFDNLPRVSVIGTRRPSKEGIANAHKIVSLFAKKGVIIVSGLALGIDTIAHRTTIEYGGSTIAVIGTPIDKYYPPENRELQNEIIKNHLLVSQFTVGSPIERRNFPMRNRTMALLSHASIIVEANDDSGSIHQGWEALRLGRPLFILKNLAENGNLTWPEKLMEYGAYIIPISKIDSVFESIPLPAKELENPCSFLI